MATVHAALKFRPMAILILATLEYGNKFMVLDKDFNFVRTVAYWRNALWHFVMMTAGEHIYVAANKSKTLEVFDAKTYEKIKESPLETVAGTLALRQMTNKFYWLAVNQMQFW